MRDESEHASGPIRRVTILGLAMNLLLAAGKGAVGFLVSSQSRVSGQRFVT